MNANDNGHSTFSVRRAGARKYYYRDDHKAEVHSHIITWRSRVLAREELAVDVIEGPRE